MEYVGILVAMAFGAGGNALGKSPLTGPKSWNKLLAPAAALAAGLVYTKATGQDLPPTEVMAAGTAVATQAVGIYSAGKNLIQLFKRKD